MEQYRQLSSSEKEYLLSVCKNDATRKIIHIFFSLWKAVFILSVIGVIYSAAEAVMEKDYFGLLVILGLPMSYLWFWLFPTFLLKIVDAKYTALKEDRVYVRDTELVSVRYSRERTSSSSSSFKDVYYVSVWNENKTHTYDVQAHESLCNMVELRSRISVLRFTGKGFKDPESQEYALPYNFISNPEITSLPL